MAEAEFDGTQKLTQQNELIVNDAEHKANDGMQCMSNSEQLAGDPVSVTAEDLQVEDLAGPTVEEGIDTPLKSAKADADGPKASSQMQKKTTMSSAAGKANGATSSSPTVKKVLNSGTFGVGSAKPSGVKGSMAPQATRPTAPALRKSATSPPATAKPPLTSSTSSKPSAATRRTSIAPTKSGGPPLSKPPLSSLATTKPSTEDATLRASSTGSVVTAKTPAATPVQSRPRASVSEAVKKAPLTSRPSVASSVKAAPTKATTIASRSSAAPSTKSSRPTGSITSLKEVKDESKEVKGDNKALIQLQSQLEEALDVKVAAVADLEGRITILEESLMSATSEVGLKTDFISDLETAKISAESQLADAQEALDKVHERLTEVRLSLESVEKELESARLAASTRDELVQALQFQIKDLEATAASYDEQINQLKESHASATSALTESTSIQHESLLKAQADVDTILEELKALRLAHANVNTELGNKVTELKEKTEAVESLQTQLTSAKAEREENVHRISELEVEVLELKELQEGLEDTRDSFQERITALEQDLANAASAAECAAEAANKKETDHGEELNTQVEKHQMELEVEAARFANIASALEKLNAEYAEAVAAHEKTKEEILDKEKQHTTSLEEREKSHADAIAALSSQLENVAHELNDQASIYNSKVDAVKAEHAKLLEEAFERAKSEAAQAHGQELQALRSDSNVAIDQIQEGNRVALEELKAEHASLLESEASSLNKQINNLNVELKATQEDLAKAKAALEASRAEVESLTKQRDEARAQAEAVPDISPEHAEEIARLTRELSKTKDDLAATTDTLNLTKSLMAELSDKQAAELEAAAKGRADEVLQLRAVHDKEISDLATRKSELLVKLSDLEGELVTAKAALATHEASSQVNVDGASHPPSSPGVPREELQKLHEAHNLKIHDLEAEHDKAVKAAKEELEGALNKISELEQDISRKAMEIQYMEQEHEEGQERITRLKEDVETLSEKLAQSA